MTFISKETAVEEGGQIGGAIGGVIGGVIDATEALTKKKEALKLIAANTSITYNDIAEALAINEFAVGKHISAINNKGFLIRQGDTRAYWEINLDEK
ncbi:hypothetical protein ACNKXS_05980 [Christiangramia marina]|uniref:hypothetical protein n=1 Tax=Christiangramia marina TaxID=409436 RepID=UPI003AA83DDE